MASDFADATRAYSRWLARYLALDAKGLAEKRRKMDKKARFPFLRGTVYRWPAQFAAVDAEVRAAPRVLSVGDAHLENFGTWRDAEGRFAWGVNDFDDAAPLPLTSDLVRLAASFLVAREDEGAAIAVGKREGIAALLAGYRDGLGSGQPFILETEELEPIRRAALGATSPAGHWAELQQEGEADGPADPALLHLLLTALPQGARGPVFRRVQKGLGSLGRPRWVVIARWNGGFVAREAKATAPSALRAGEPVPPADRIRDHRRLVGEARRAPDPGFLLTEDWVVRRLSPEMHKIELAAMLRATGVAGQAAPDAAAQAALLRAMGAEIANLHAGATGDPAALGGWLAARDGDGAWLLAAARAAVERIEADHAAFRADPGVVSALPED